MAKFCLADTVVTDELRLRLEKPDASPTVSPAYRDWSFRGRVSLLWSNDQFESQFQPQYSSLDYFGSNSPKDISAAAFYQLWVKYKLNEKLSVKLGRQELTFGSERLLGRADWNDFGRFFDAARVDYNQGLNSLSFFFSKIAFTPNEVDVSGGPNSFAVRHDFFGAYFTMRNFWADAFDFYFLYNDNPETGPQFHLATYGSRFEKRTPTFFAETEVTAQNGISANQTELSEHQFDVELGPTIDVAEGLDCTVEWAEASRNFNQLFPSAHEFLGAMDYFGRRNIRDLVAHLRLRTESKWFANFEFHTMSVVDIAGGGTAFDLAGAHAVAGGGGSSALGNELDFALQKKFRQALLSAGFSHFIPGKYFAQTVATDLIYLETKFGFL